MQEGTRDTVAGKLTGNEWSVITFSVGSLVDVALALIMEHCHTVSPTTESTARVSLLHCVPHLSAVKENVSLILSLKLS